MPARQTTSAELLQWVKDQTSSKEACHKRDEYQQRLETFQTTTYAAKPPCLSPILCARFGWCNADQDMLSCPTCDAALSIQIPDNPFLGLRVIDKIVAAYREQLVQAHGRDCPFARDTIRNASHFSKESTGTACTSKPEAESTIKSTAVVPIAFASVLSPHALQLMEHPHPEDLLKDRVKDFLAAKRTHNAGSTGDDLAEVDQDQNELRLALTTPDELKYFSSENGSENDAAAETSAQTNFLSLTAAAAGVGTQDVEQELALVLLGWIPLKKNVSDSSNDDFQVQCPVCLACKQIPLTDTSHDDTSTQDDSATIDEDDGTVTRVAKRPRRSALFHPIHAHRYYCPFVCGFPTDTSTRDEPMWKSIAKKLCTTIQNAETGSVTQNNSDNEADQLSASTTGVDVSIERIKNILRAGLHKIPRKEILS